MKDREELIVKALFEELSPEERRALEADAEAARDVRAFREVLDVTARRGRPEPPPAFWETYADRLADRMDREERRLDPWGRLQAVVRRLADDARALVAPVPGWALQGVCAVLLLATGVWIGKTYYAVPSGTGPVVEGRGLVPPAHIRSAALEDRTRRYMDRSKVLLLGLVNFDTATEDPATLNLGRHQEIARSLVDEAGGLKDDLEAANEQRLRELVADLEMILLQIANLEAEHDVPAIEMVQSAADRKALLLKINVEEMRLSVPGSGEEDRTSGEPVI